MKYLIALALFAALLAGCSAVSSQESGIPQAGVVGNNTNNDTQVPTPEPTHENVTPAQKPISQEPMSVTGNPPRVPISPIQGAPGSPVSTLNPPEGWQVFTSTHLGVTLYYPNDWSALDNGDEIKFSSPQGQLILLQAGQSNGGASTNGQDCTALTNRYGLTGEICSDPASSSYNAVIKNLADASASELILSTISPEKPTVFLQIFDSLRFTQ